MEIEIVVTSSYGILSRGRHSARLGNGASVRWAEKNVKGQLVIREPGLWNLHCSDGFRREARAVIEVKEDGTWEMGGDTKRFDVVN